MRWSNLTNISQGRRRAMVGLLIAATLAGVPIAAAFEGGGVVENMPPQILDVTHELGDADVGETDVFTARLFDHNGPQDITRVRFIEENAAIDGSSHLVTEAERNQQFEPDFDETGWKVWNPTPGSGALYAKYRITYPEPPATYRFAMGVSDEQAFVDSAYIQVRVFVPLRVESDPVDWDGVALPGERWGGWSVQPDDGLVESQNFMKIVNGRDPEASMVLDFTSATFTGTYHAIPIDGNIAIRTWEDRTPDSSSPREAPAGVLDFGDRLLPTPEEVSEAGSATVRFTAGGNILYVAYQIIQVPGVVADETYAASFTVTEA